MDICILLLDIPLYILWNPSLQWSALNKHHQVLFHLKYCANLSTGESFVDDYTGIWDHLCCFPVLNDCWCSHSFNKVCWRRLWKNTCSPNREEKSLYLPSRKRGAQKMPLVTSNLLNVLMSFIYLHELFDLKGRKKLLISWILPVLSGFL